MTTLAERLRPSTLVKNWVNPQPAPAYVRPADWLALPVVNTGDQKFVGLHAVYSHDSNFVAVNCAGAYTVDWGDGTAAENIATGVQANHNYVYSALGAGTLSTRGYRQAVVTITPQGGSNLTTVNLLVKHSQSGLVGGYTSGWLDIRVAGSLITILTIAAASTTTLVHRMLEQFEFVGTNGITTCVAKFANCSSLQSLVAFYTGSVTTFAQMFQSCSSLQTIPLLNTAAATGTAFSSMFASCVSLRSVPLLNTAAGTATAFSSMFSGCSSLQQIPLLNTASGTSFDAMFSNCLSLQQIPLLNTGAGLAFTSMFQNCIALQSVPALNTAAGTDFTSMFATCPSLRSAPLAGTAKTISYASCSVGPAALDAIYTALFTFTNLLSDNAASVETSVADWNVSPVNCATFQSNAAFADGANSLRLTSTASGVASAAITTRLAVSASTQYTFLSSSIHSTTGRAWTVAIAWYDAGGSLISTDTSGVLTPSPSVWGQNAVTATSPANAVTASVIVSYTATAGAQLVYFDKMGLFPGTVSVWTPGKAVITVTSNWGVASDTPSIATAKGWTVTGS